MALFLNIIAAIFMVVYSFTIYISHHKKIVRHPTNPRARCYINRDLHFLIFCMATAMIFLGPLSLIKYAFWIVFMLFLAFSRFKIKIDIIIFSYLMFLLWALISLTYSSVKIQGFMLIIKYSLPLLYLWLGYNAINDKNDFVFLLKKTAWIMVIYALLIGGFSAKLLPWLYAFLCFKTGGLVIAYASLADFYSALFVVPLALYVIFKDKKWLIVAGWVTLSTILEVVRTGIGGIFLATSFFLFFYYKAKALPWLFGLVLLAASVFLIPEVREKMFNDDRMTISSLDSSAINFDNIQSNGREVIWESNLARFFNPNPVFGAGLGESMEYTKNSPFPVKLIHSDYVQILCDTGLIGIILFGFFFLITLFKVISRTWGHNSNSFIRLTGAMALGSCAGTFFSMAFDNVISYAQQSFVIPFIFIGIFLKSIDLQKRKSL